MDFTHNLRKMTFEGKTYNVLTDEELYDLLESKIFELRYESGAVDLEDFDHFVKERKEKYGL